MSHGMGGHGGHGGHGTPGFGRVGFGAHPHHPHHPYPPTFCPHFDRICCFIFPCFWLFGPPHPHPPPHEYQYQEIRSSPAAVVVNTGGNNGSNYGTAESNSTFSSIHQPNTDSSLIKQAYREVHSLDYVYGRDVPTRFYVQVPSDAKSGNLLKCNLGGKEQTIRLPENIVSGETIIVVSPSVSIPTATSL